MPDGSDVVYRYDGTFDGFLCCVFESVYSRTTPADIVAEDTLLPMREIATDTEKAARVANGIKTKIHVGVYEMVEVGFRANVPHKELLLLKYLLLGFQVGAKVLNMLTHEDVAPVPYLKKKVYDETHRMKEFVRFSDYDGTLVSVIEPKHDVLELIAPHFSDRLRGETFMIYDEGRGKAYVYDKGQCGYIFIDRLELPAASDQEREFRRLWKLFFDTVEIQSRHNERCQTNHLPKFYRKNMTEFKRL